MQCQPRPNFRKIKALSDQQEKSFQTIEGQKIITTKIAYYTVPERVNPFVNQFENRCVLYVKHVKHGWLISVRLSRPETSVASIKFAWLTFGLKNEEVNHEKNTHHHYVINRFCSGCQR
jgi:hypothetical protein